MNGFRGGGAEPSGNGTRPGIEAGTRHKKDVPVRLPEVVGEEPSTSSSRWAMQGSQRRSHPISNLAEQSHQIVDAPFEEAAALQRQTVMQQEYPAELDQTPEAPLGAVVGREHERVVGDPELKHPRQARVGLGNRVEFLLRDAEGGCAAAE